MQSFLFSQIALFTAMYCLFFVFGTIVNLGWLKANYSRKIVSYLFFVGQILSTPYFPGFMNQSLRYFYSTLSILIFFGSFSQIISSHSFLQTCFKAVKRPEDEPHSLQWIFTEYIAMYGVVNICIWFLDRGTFLPLILLALQIVLLADGLAEPIGIALGKHKFRTFALFTQKTYVRTLEGSMCVGLVTFFIVLSYRSAFSPAQLCWALGLIPVSSMLSEAFSPHSCDGPFITLAVTLDLLLIDKFIPLT